MLKRKSIAILTIMLMILSMVPLMLGTGSGDEGTRWGDPATGFITERAKSQLYKGYMSNSKTTEYLDLTNDGRIDMFSICHHNNGTEFFTIVELYNGNTLIEYTFDETYLYYDILDTTGTGMYDIVFVQSDGTDQLLSVYRPRTNSWMVYNDVYTGTLLAGDMEPEIIHQELVIHQVDSSGRYCLHTYDAANYASMVHYKRLPNFMPISFENKNDLDGDGHRDIMAMGAWGGADIYYYVFDINEDIEVMNATEGGLIGGFTWTTAYLNNDNQMEILFFCNFGNGTSQIICYSGVTTGQYTLNYRSGNHLSIDSNLDIIYFGDFDGDGIDDILFERETTEDVLYMMGGMDGIVFFEINLLVSPGYEVYVGEFTGDNAADVFIWSTSNPGNLQLRSYHGGAPPTEEANITRDIGLAINGVGLANHLADYDNDGTMEYHLAMTDATAINFTLFELAYLTESFFVSVDSGDAGGFTATYALHWSGSSALLEINNNYQDSGNPNYRQFHIYNLSTKTAVYSTYQVSDADYDGFRGFFIHPLDLNGDGHLDFWFHMLVEDSGFTYQMTQITCVNGNGWAEHNITTPWVDTGGGTASFNVWAMDINGGAKEMILGMWTQIDSEPLVWNYTAFNLAGWAFGNMYNEKFIGAGNWSTFSNRDFTGDGVHDMWNVHWESGSMAEVTFFAYNSGTSRMEQKKVITLYVQSVNLEYETYNPENDDDVTIVFQEPVAIPWIKIYNTRNWDLTGDYTAFVGLNSLVVNANSDRSSDMIITPIQPIADGENHSQMYIHDLESGLRHWESLDMNFYPYDSIHGFDNVVVLDVENDGRKELILEQMGLSIDTEFFFRIQTNNIATNKMPTITGAPMGIEFPEDTMDNSIDLSAIFGDPDGDTLVYTINEPTGMLTFDHAGAALNITPMAEWSGNVTVNITATDGYWELGFEFYVNVTPVNDLPMIYNITGLNATIDTTMDKMAVYTDVMQGDEASLQLTAMDMDSQDVLTYALSNITGLNATVDNATGLILYTPDVDDGPYVEFIVNVTDTNMTNDSVLIKMNIKNIEHGPYNVSIVAPEADAFLEGKFNLTSSHAMDLDIPWGDELNYTWESDVDGILGYGMELIDVSLTMGYHNITLTVEDATGLTAEDTIQVFMNKSGGPGTIDPEWWAIGFDNDKEGTGNESVTVKFTLAKVNVTTEMDVPEEGKMTVTTKIELAGTCSDDVVIVHLYRGMQTNDEDFTVYPFTDPADYITKVEVTPEDGKWEWSYDDSAEYDIPEPTGDDDDDVEPSTDVYHDWFAAVGWNNMGDYDIAFREAKADDIPDPTDDDDDDDDDDEILPEWWDLGFATGDKDDEVESAVKVAWTKCDVESTIEEDKPAEGKTTSTTVYTFEGTCSDDVTVVYIYTGTQINDDDFVYMAAYDMTDMADMKKIEIEPEDGKWTYTWTYVLEYDTPEPEADDDDVEPSTDTYTSWYSAVAWAPTGFNIAETKVGEAAADDDTDDDDDDDDDDTGYSAGAFFGVLGAMIFFILLVIILIIVLIVMASKKKSADEPEKPPEELPPPEDELPPPEDSELGPPPPEDAEGELGPEDVPPPEEYDEEMLEEEPDLSEDEDFIEDDLDEPPEADDDDVWDDDEELEEMAPPPPGGDEDFDEDDDDIWDDDEEEVDFD